MSNEKTVAIDRLFASWLIGGGCAIIIATFAALMAGQALAEVRVRGQHATSKQPYWNVGRIDKDLTAACQRGEFKQRRYVTYSVGFIGERGRGLTGIANKEWNLVDPKGLAKTGFTYHFFNQGFSNCKVYVARTPEKRNDGNN